MSFGEDLQQLSSHRALLQLQDAEIQLLEVMKKCINWRIKSDRDYANALTTMVGMAQKLDTSICNPLFQVWNGIVQETRSWIDILRDHAEKLATNTVDKLMHVINEKKSARKFYQEERIRLDAEVCKLRDEVSRLKADYQKTVEKQIQDRFKLEDLLARAAPPKKVEDARTRLCKTSTKLHKIHNDYVIAIQQVTLYQKHLLNTTLPGMLNYQEQIQQNLVAQCKSVLASYADLTDLSTSEHTLLYKSIHDKVDSISPTTEYETFLQENKSDKLQAPSFEFDTTLLQGYVGSLKQNELALDDLTIETVQHNHSSVSEQLLECQQKITNKESNHGMQKDQLVKMQTGSSSMSDMKRNSYTIHQRAVLDLEREVQELRCREAMLKEIRDTYKKRLEQLGDKQPPRGVDLLTDGASSTSSNGRQDSGTTTNSRGNLAKNLHSRFDGIIGRFRSPPTNGPTPPPPPRDFTSGNTGDNDMAGRSSLHNYEPEDLNPSRPSQADKPRQYTDSYQQMIPNPLRKLDDEDWYHGVLPREEVQRLLVNDGDYLVRASKKKQTNETVYVLSVFAGDHKHFIIQGQEGNWRFEGEQYPSIQSLIINQHNSGQPVTRKSGAILRKPIVRENWELKNDDIVLGQKIGNGNFGDVFKGTFRPQNKEVAIKTCRETLSEDAKKKFLQEGRILKQYEHVNIVRFIGIAAQRHPVMIVMEYVPGGSLLNFLKKQGLHQTKKQLVKMCEDASAGMAYLEERNCIHRDLAARNCLVGKANIVKISDFGMSREEEEYTVSGGLKQIPIKWTAPEALNYGTYTSACDVWSFAVLMWEVFSFGQSPYPGLTNTQARERVDDGYRMPSPENTPPAAYELMLRCWHQEPKERPRFEDIHKELQKIHKSLLFR